jgi:hypothetical protein
MPLKMRNFETFPQFKKKEMATLNKPIIEATCIQVLLCLIDCNVGYGNLE